MKKLLYILLFVPLALFGQGNYSLSFDGDNDYVNLGDNSFLPTNSVTFGFRIKNNFGDFEIITSDMSYTTYTVRIENGELFFRIFPIAGGGANGQIITHPIMFGEWQYVFCTWDGNEMKIYVNNSLMNTGILVADSVSFTESDIYLGTYPTFPDDSFFNGKIDEVIIFNYAITQEEIQSYMNCQPSGYVDGLVGYWKFNEGSGDTVYDISGNGNNGIIFGANYDSEFYENTCIGCKNPNAINYDEYALEEDEHVCIYSQEYVYGLSNEVVESLSSLQQALDTWNTTIDLSAGWNMFGYGCPSSIDVADGLSNHTESIIITKDNNGNVYMPEFGFNGIGDFTPGFGYQIKLTEAIEGFSLCDWYVNDIPEDNIVSLQEENASLQEEVDFMSTYFGCIDELACNYDETILLSDGSCEYAESGFHCDGSQIQIGDFYGGGIIFYLDETGQHGLIASTENSSVGSILWGGAGDTLFNGYEWGCSGVEVDGADGIIIGSGYQNTIDIVNQECVTGGITAAEAAMEYNYSGYNDWYLPSKDELYEMYIRIGYGANENIGNFDYDWYWSSTENSYDKSWIVNFQTTIVHANDKLNIGMVRPIRSF